MAKINLANVIWQAADDQLRGLVKPHQYGEIILPFFVLKRLDSVLKKLDPENKAKEIFIKHQGSLDQERLESLIFTQTKLPYYNTAEYDFDAIAGDQNNATENFRNYISSFSSNIIEIIDNFKFQDELQTLEDNNRFWSFLQNFAGIDMSPENYSNSEIGIIYEELLRRWSEMSNETAGEHFTPRDIVKLLVGLVFNGKENEVPKTGSIRSIYDPCCGTGGMLTTAKRYIEENFSNNIEIILRGQELNPQTHSVCKADFLMLGLDSNNIHGPLSTFASDTYTEEKFHFQLANPPFGISWKSDQDHVKDEFNDQTFNGRSRFKHLPRISDGQLLFLQIMIDKMVPKDGRIGMVSNGSPLFTGDAGSGESEIRKYIFENDLLEAIVALPDRMFYNTGIATYLWILNNNKSDDRKNKVQLIDASEMGSNLRKNLGDKNKEISDESRIKVIELFDNFEEDEISKIYDTSFFGYTKVNIEQPLRENGEIVTNKKGDKKSDPTKRDHERIPLSENIDEYFDREVKPHLPDAWMDRSKDVIGYEINFTKYFYKFQPLRSIDEITADLKSVDSEIHELFSELGNE
tara:strand:+ start:3927 stop:5657 length:1731 start_codon:yes stop_codon:yes gene_type:complete